MPCGLANSMQREEMAVMQSYSISLLLDIYHQLEGDQPMVNCWWLTISRYLIMTKGVTVKVITPVQLNDLDDMALTQNYTIEGLRHLAHLAPIHQHCRLSFSLEHIHDLKFPGQCSLPATLVTFCSLTFIIIN